ncbi:hypothetical protein J3R82DRAFT_2800 [Butyriboletus roseoflavus]|nr:hypothetical protein J3R82DRAFT_2800 [Butyriboletus roseoflavus]
MNGTYNFSSFNTGFSTNTTIGFSENMLDTSGFGRTATAPLISQANLSQTNLSQSVGYSQAYMQDTLTLNERCKVLETQLIKVTTERDTLKMMLEQLSVSLQKPMSPKLSSAEMYPKLHFWTQRQYNEWTNTPEAHGNSRYKFAFLEDEQGNMISDGTLKAIRKTIHGCWAELVVKGMAPRSWGKANASAKEIVYSLAYKSFPFLQLAESDWKIDLIYSLDYPRWVRNNLDDKGNWLASRRVKQEEEATIVDEPGGSTSNPKKCKAKPLKSEAIEKKFKDDLAQENSLVTQATTPDILTGGLSTSEFAGPPLLPVTPSSPVQVPTASLPSVSSTTLAERDASATSLLTLSGNVSTSTTVSSPSTFSSTPTTPTSDPNIDLPTQALSITVAKGTMGIPGELTKVSDDADASSTIVVNPLYIQPNH